MPRESSVLSAACSQSMPSKFDPNKLHQFSSLSSLRFYCRIRANRNHHVWRTSTRGSWSQTRCRGQSLASFLGGPIWCGKRVTHDCQAVKASLKRTTKTDWRTSSTRSCNPFLTLMAWLEFDLLSPVRTGTSSTGSGCLRNLLLRWGTQVSSQRESERKGSFGGAPAQVPCWVHRLSSPKRCRLSRRFS